MAAVRTNYLQKPLIQLVPQLSWSSVMLQEMTAWGTSSSMKSKQQPSEREAKPFNIQPPLTADSSISPPAELSFYLTLQGLQRSPVSCHSVSPSHSSSPSTIFTLYFLQGQK